MSIAGWSYPASREQLYAAGTMARVMNVTRGEGEAPFVPDWPWPSEPEEAAVSDEERAALTARLKRTSAFGQLRTEGPDDV